MNKANKTSILINTTFLLCCLSVPVAAKSVWDILKWSAKSPTPELWQGYIEGEFLWLSPAVAGQLAVVKVEKGLKVQANDLLFQLVAEPDNLALQEAEYKLRATQARLMDIQKGARPAELAEIKARIKQTEADLALAKIELERTEKLLQKKALAQDTVDANRTTVQRQEARMAELQAQLAVAQLGGRTDAIQAAQAEVASMQATVAQARWRVAQKQVMAPAAGQITEVFHYPGEWVTVGTPVLALLPPDKIKLRFFVPETALGRLKLGQTVHFQCDNCNDSATATVSYIAAQAEYTPPVIYSQQTRVKLVYMIEALPTADLAPLLHSGQPVTVWLP
jgi:HlyD family secretion protein